MSNSVDAVEANVAKTDQYSRRDTVVVTGLDHNPETETHSALTGAVSILYYNIICVIIFLLFAGCGVIVGRLDILPCAAPFKSLQGLGVPFSFLSFK